VSLDESVALCRGVLGRPICHVATEVTPIPQRADALLAARLVGLAEGACTLATSYAQLREQFGKPIGSFQAIKHRCADMYLRAEMSAQLVALACLKIEAGAADAALQVAAARLKSAQSAYENGRAGIQVHGGLGFHAECDAHRFVKRAHVYDQIGGNLHAQARRVFAAQSPLW
jgi:alkylation response protein AidB-like acyl-CoA dehydrogenase